jgi:putative acetyltransferase
VDVTGYVIHPDDLTHPEILALLQLHLDEMHQWSPPESVHAMPAERLRAPDVAFYAAWHGERLAAVGAIKQLDSAHGELKSMRAHPDYRGKGAGRAMLDHLLAVARARGYQPAARSRSCPLGGSMKPTALPSVRRSGITYPMTSPFV